MKTIIRISILLLTLTPATVVAIILIAYLNNTRIQDLERSLAASSQVIVDQLAAASESALRLQDTDLLDALARSAFRMPAVVGITIEDAGGETVVKLGQSDLQALSGRSLQRFEALVHPTADNRVIGAADLDNPDRRVLGLVRVDVSREALTHRHKQVIWNSFLLLFCALPIIALFGWHMGRRICDPFLRLERLIERLRTEWLTRFPRGLSSSELGDLGRDIRATGRVLEVSKKHLQKHMEAAAADLHERLDRLQAENQALDTARRQAVDAGRIKSAFLADMSSEIRTPLNTITGSIGWLARTDAGPGRQACLQELRVAAEALRAVLDDMLDFFSIDSGRFKLRMRPFDIREVLERTLAPFEESARRQKLKLRLRVDSDIPTGLLGDASCIARIVTTLVRRTVDLAEPGKMELRVRKDLESNSKITLGLEIRNTRLGLDSTNREEMARVFDSGNADEMGPFDGFLGLDEMIARQLVALMDGHIHVRGRRAATVVTLVVEKPQIQQNTAGRGLSSSETS